MAITDLQGKVIPFLVSDDNWTTAYTLVCLQQGSFKSSFNVNTEESQCGVHTGIGPIQFTVSVAGAVNTTPAAVSAGAGEASYKKLQTWHNSQTLLRFKLQSPSSGTPGTDFYNEGQMYLNELSFEAQVGQVIKYNATLTGTGTNDITP